MSATEQPPCSTCKRPMKSLQEFVSHNCPGFLFTSREVDERVAATRKAVLEEVRAEIANDGPAMTCQTLGQYRTLILNWLNTQLRCSHE